MLKTFFVKLDVEKNIYAPAQIQFNVSNNDYDSVEVSFQIFQDDNPFDLSGKTVELGIRKPSGMAVYQNVEITNAVLGEITAILLNQAYTEYGIHFAEIYIRDADQMIVTPPFYFMSFESVMSGAIESTNDWSAFQQVLFLYDKKPLVVEGFPTEIPEYIGQTAIDLVNGIFFVANDLNAESWVPVGSGEGGSGIVTWETILNKPATFPSEAHSHVIAEIEGLQIALDAKANADDIDGGVPADHTHEIADVNGLQTALDFKAENIHNHDLADITGLQSALDSKADDLHNHGIADITGLQPALDRKADEVHSHDMGSITGLQNALDGKVDDAQMQTKADLDHDHSILDITGLQASLDAKADQNELDKKANKGDSYTKAETYKKSELYTKTEIDQFTMGDGGGSPVIVEDNLESISTTNALSSNQGRILNETKAPVDHVHDVTEITGLSTELSTKADINHNHDLAYSPIDHNHDLQYAPLQHTHDQYVLKDHTHPEHAPADHHHNEQYATKDHNHTIADVTGLQPALDGKADDADLAGKADVNHSHSFGSLTDVPTEFPPEAHNHTIANVIALKSALDAKAPVDHNHDLQYSPINHEHTIADVTGLQIALDGKADDADLAGKADVNHSHSFGSLTGIPSAFPPDAHAHEIADITGLQTALDEKTIGEHNHDDQYYKKNEQLNVDSKAQVVSASFKNVNGEIAMLIHKNVNAFQSWNEVEGAKPFSIEGFNGGILPSITLKGTKVNAVGNLQEGGVNLSDAYAPIDHNHDQKYSPINHDHGIAEISGLQTALDGKAPVGHTHDFGSLTRLPATFTPSAHAHGINEITGLQNALDAKTTNTYVDAGDNYILETRMAGLSLWKGTQAQYDALGTPDPTTLYFIVG